MTPREEEYGTGSMEYGTTATEEEAQPISEKSPAELEEEISQIRADMDSTLDAIERRFSAGELLDRGLHYLTGGPRDYTVNLGRTVRDNPVPATLVGIGLAWLMFSGSGRHAESAGVAVTAGEGVAAETRRRLREKSGAASEKMHQVTGAVSERMHRAGERLHGMGERARGTREKMGRAGGSVSQQAKRARSGFSYLLHEQPLVLAALGLAVGAILGASIPATRREAELMGEAGESLRTGAQQKAREQMEKAQRVVQSATEAAQEETERQLH